MAAILALQEVQGTRELLELLVRRVRRVRLELLEQQALREEALQAGGPHLEADQVINHKPPTLHLVVATRRCFRLIVSRVPMLELRLPLLRPMYSN
jgi:hypothetical protein